MLIAQSRALGMAIKQTSGRRLTKLRERLQIGGLSPRNLGRDLLKAGMELVEFPLQAEAEGFR